MRFATLKGERSVSELAGRLFRLRGPGMGARAREVETALVRANPQLRDLERLPEGVMIVVPEIADVEPAEEARPVDVGASAVVGEVRRVLGDVRTALGAAAANHAAEATETLNLLKSRELKALAGTTPGLSERLPRIADAAHERLKEAKATQAFQEQALAQLERDLDDLMKRLP